MGHTMHDVLIQHPEEMILVSIPLLLGFIIILGINLFVTKFAGFRYREAIISVIIVLQVILKSLLVNFSIAESYLRFTFKPFFLRYVLASRIDILRKWKIEATRRVVAPP